jgi:hypothetical protein
LVEAGAEPQRQAVRPRQALGPPLELQAPRPAAARAVAVELEPRLGLLEPPLADRHMTLSVSRHASPT